MVILDVRACLLFRPDVWLLDVEETLSVGAKFGKTLGLSPVSIFALREDAFDPRWDRTALGAFGRSIGTDIPQGLVGDSPTRISLSGFSKCDWRCSGSVSVGSWVVWLLTWFAHFSTTSPDFWSTTLGLSGRSFGRYCLCLFPRPWIMLTKFPYLASNFRMLFSFCWYRFTQISWLLGISCLWFSKYCAISSGECLSRKRIGHIPQDLASSTDLADRLSWWNSAAIGSLWPEAARGADLEVVTKGHSNLLGFPGTVKSISISSLAS